MARRSSPTTSLDFLPRPLIAHVFSDLLCPRLCPYPFPPSCCLCLCHTVLYTEDIIVFRMLVLVRY